MNTTRRSRGPSDGPGGVQRPLTTGATGATGNMLSELYSSVVGDQERLTKLPLVVSRDMEERFIRDGWPVGKVYGSEADMAAYYGVGRDVMREAVRVLEARDEVRVRRGPQGGIAVARPGGTHLLVMIGGYAYLTGLGLPDIVEAWSAVHISAVRLIGDRSRQAGGRPLGESQAADDDGIPDTAGLLGRFAAEVIGGSGSGPLKYFNDVLAPLLPRMSTALGADALADIRQRIIHDLDRGRTEDAVRLARTLFCGAARDTLAQVARTGGWKGTPVPEPLEQMRIPAFAAVRRMMSEITPEEWVRGRPLGNECELAERFGVDRSVIRQAIRMMEDAETAVTLPGRGHGLVTRCPSPAPLSRQVCVYLASHAEPPEEAALALGSLMIEMAEIAARKTGPRDAELFDALFDELRQLTSAAPISSVQLIERLQNRLARNVLLSLFINGIKAYVSWSMSEELHAPSWVIEFFAQSTHDVLRAIGRRDAPEAARLQAVKQEMLAKYRQCVLEGRDPEVR